MATLEQAVAAIQDIVGALAGIKAAPDTPPESMNQFPFAVCYPLRFTAVGGPAGMVKGLHTVKIEIHCLRQSLPKDVALAGPYGRLVYRALWNDPRLNNTVDTINEIRGEFGFLAWGSTADRHVGWSIEVDFKLEESTS